MFRGLVYTVVETGLKHGTVTVVGNDDSYEVTTFRQDGDYVDGRCPDTVEFCSNVKEDLARRDFTINAIAWNPKSGLIDPFGGQKDIENKIIRCVGNPGQRFQEDGLRVLRAVRFASVLNFFIDIYTEIAVWENAKHLKWISMERKRDELMKMLPGVSFAGSCNIRRLGSISKSSRLVHSSQSVSCAVAVGTRTQM